ncbi:MAG: hypothetical protein KGJ86_00635 [Chloroflexota bacterium]|nr:hypothetical protein [Chloroflexota bacterium]
MAQNPNPKSGVLSPAAAASPAAAVPKTSRVYNRREAWIIHGPHRLPPRSFLDVPTEVAQLWFSHFPNDVVEAGVAQKELNGVQAENAELREKLAALEAKLKAAESAV